MASIY